MRRPLILILAIAALGSGVLGYLDYLLRHPPAPASMVRYCDLYIADGDLCFERTDGQGKRVAVSPAEEAIIVKLFQEKPCAPVISPRVESDAEKIAEARP